MVILLVDDQQDRLEKIEEMLSALYPTAQIIAESDPLMAGKYALFHPVDLLISALRMRRADGMVMKKMVRYANEDANVYLMGTMDHFDQWELVNSGGQLIDSDIDGLLYEPVTKETLEGALCSKESEADGQVVQRTIGEVYESLQHSETLQWQLAQAAMDDDLETFFHNQGCDEPLRAIQEYFQKKTRSLTVELTEDELESITGGVENPQSFSGMILNWMDLGVDLMNR